MLTKEDNEILTHVGPGTLMGNLLRRYWMPALLCEEVGAPEDPPIRVRILGEDLVAFRDTNGEVGLLAANCPHRGASLFFGRNEENGLRCVYHGWKFDVHGACVDMPSEPIATNFKSKISADAYPTHESGGIVWAYMGPPETMTGFRDLGADSLPRESWQASKVISTCNWVQGLEGNIDTTHISFLHRNLADFDILPDETDRPGIPSPQMSTFVRGYDRAPDLAVHDTWYGFRYAGLRNTPNGNVHVRVTDFILPFTCHIAAIPVGGTSCIMMVPIDDNNFWRMSFTTKAGPRAPQGGVTNQAPIGARPGNIQRRTQWPDNDYLISREDQRGFSYTGILGIAQQDMAVTESMGPIYDRTREHLGTTDKAVIRMRQLLIEAARSLAEGIEPPAVDPSLPYAEIRSAERIISPSEDWTVLGTDQDPLLQSNAQAIPS